MYFYLEFCSLIRNFAPAKVQKMIETLLISTLIIAIAMLFFLVRVLFVKQGEFKSQHIHDSEAMKERGIHCVMDMDREMREGAKRHSLMKNEE
jgi:hypothetical protein